MKVLLVASYNSGRFSSFVIEQADALQQAGCEVEWFGIKGKGVIGYLHNLSALKRKIIDYAPDIIHAHYGLSGLLANLQRHVPVITTYHGSDINNPYLRLFSRLAIRMSAWNIFVSRRTMKLVKHNINFTLLPCGVNLQMLQVTDKIIARKTMQMVPNKRYVLFSGVFDNKIKNIQLAKETLNHISDANIELLELKGYSREQVSLLMCAVDALLMTSFTEGSPQVIKEAMACGCPIVSVDVGDVRERTAGVDGCYVADTREPQQLAELLKKALTFSGRTKGREKIIADKLGNHSVAKQLIDIYKMTLVNA